MTAVGKDSKRPTASAQLVRPTAPLRAEAVHFYGLDVLRLLAALLVVMDHFSLFGWQVATARAVGKEVAFPFLHSMSNIGSAGVEIFFLISGYVISQSTLRESAPRFAIKRAIRLLPALWMCGLLALIARASLGESGQTLTLAFLRSAVLSPVGPYIDGVVWTLVVEAVFYACVFVCLAVPTRLSLKGLAYVIAIPSTAFIVVMCLADQHVLGTALSSRALAVLDRFPFKVLLLREGVFFSAGILLWLRTRMGSTPGQTAMLGIILLGCTLELTIMRAKGIELIAAISVWWFSLILLLVSVRYATRIAARLGRLRPAVISAGNFSYPLYLTHYTVGYVLVYQFSRLGLSRGAVAVLSLTTILAMSGFVAFGPEPRVQAFLRARWLKRTPRLKVVGGPVNDRAG